METVIVNLYDKILKMTRLQKDSQKALSKFWYYDKYESTKAQGYHTLQVKITLQLKLFLKLVSGNVVLIYKTHLDVRVS